MTRRAIYERRKARREQQYKIDGVKYKDKLYQHYGFKNTSDYYKQLRILVMKLVFLNIGYVNPIITHSYLRSKLKREFIEKYKDVQIKCACCGENHLEFLTLDHKNNDGAEHRKKSNGASGGMLCDKMLSVGFDTADYQVLCCNCNLSLALNGFCPHHPEIIRKITVGKPKKINEEPIKLIKNIKLHPIFNMVTI